MSARDDVLRRIRSALGPDRPAPAPIARTYRTASVETGAAPSDVLDRFVDRLEDYKATVHRTTGSALAETVAAAVTARGARRLVVPKRLPAEWISALDGVEISRDDPALSLDELDATDGVVTACRVAIVETGTIVLDAGPNQGRRALTLVPDWHLCIVHAEQVVTGVPEGISRLDPTRPLTFVSGPSATSDIELQRVEGVHGPRTLVVVLVTD